MTAWDESSRRLGDRWGDRDIAALGMRAAFVGWRALFARVGIALKPVRALLAPGSPRWPACTSPVGARW